ncbi:MAG: AAA family ATPase [Chloroflexi bacterium]|nr:AAA family ATPase [Chloroflexota bacterium]
MLRPITSAIEQPELHLHPRLQAKVADAFVSTIQTAKDLNLDLRLIIETHSETIVNRFGHSIAQGDLSHKDISVVLFEKSDSMKQTKVRTSYYDNEGFLIDWPLGFFDPQSD